MRVVFIAFPRESSVPAQFSKPTCFIFSLFLFVFFVGTERSSFFHCLATIATGGVVLLMTYGEVINSPPSPVEFDAEADIVRLPAEASVVTPKEFDQLA